jgi:type VI secretion system protein ImpL
VYVVVSGCEQIEGFAQFARLVPESVRASMLGWSSPYDLATTYQSQWVEDAVDSVVKTATDTSAELFALNTPTAEAGKFFLLPSRIEAIRAQLRLYVDELMRPSAYHEPFFFRGIYLTGDSSEAAMKALAASAGDTLLLPAPAAATDDAQDDLPMVIDAQDTHGIMSQLMREPAFLRDLFEKKIFQEYGLARPSKQQLTRPVLSRTVRWAGVAVILIWGVGLAVATVQLNSRHGDLSRALAQIQSDSEYRARAAERGEAIPNEWYRRKALTLLATIEKLGNDSAWTFFMPGSWRPFDDLEERAQERIEREFGEIAINTLRRELYGRASDLTGVSQDASTGELIIGGECNAPPLSGGFEMGRKLALQPEDLPEFAALLQYVGSLEQLDQAIQAMVRLQKPSATEASDLRLLVKYTLGAELPGNISRSLRYFRADPSNAQAASPASLSVAPVQQAARCTLIKGTNALDARLFVNNDLLVTEQNLQRLTTRLFAPDAAPMAYGPTTDGYRDVLATIKDQENLFGPGKGAWMRQSTLNLGAAYERVVARIAQARLLGPETADQVRQRAYFAFQKFGTDFATRMGGEATAGVVWVDKEGRFALSPDRMALRDALSGLLGQSFMTPPRGRQLPEVPSQSTVAWDTQKLDQALALGEVRKRYLNEGLPKFPLPTRHGVEVFVDTQLANLVSDYAAEAVGINPRADVTSIPDASAFDAARTRTAKVQSLLGELGARVQADSLRTVISHDAMNRLRLVDENLQRSELYSIRGRDFRWWQGERAPLLQAFGVQDATSLLQYLAQQSARAEALGRQADVYIASLDSSAAASQMAARWQGINRDLERYRLKNPNSSLGALEQFLVTLAPDLDRFNCTEKLAGKAPSGRPGDYFAERNLVIYTALSSRCNELRTRDQQDQWALFSGSFNKLVAGRQPFSQAVSRDAPVADFDDVGQMIKTYDRVSRSIKEADPARLQTQSPSAKRFADQFERVKTFLAPLYPTEDGALAGYDVAVEFRANQPAEVEGNKVIDWTLEIGGQVQRWREPAKVLRWEPGSPITLTLRLAKDSPVAPVNDANQPAMHTEGKAVVWRFADPWALLTMIQRQREPDTGARADGRSQLLRMEFPMNVAEGDGKSPPLETRSRVYMRMALSPVGKKTPLPWPGIFPVRAPEWAGP